jgi:hypothetical protein
MTEQQFQAMLAQMTPEQRQAFYDQIGSMQGGGYGMGGYNPFRMGAYSSMSAFGGMPPQASGFRYRNEMNQYDQQLANLASQPQTAESAEKMLDIQNKMQDLSAARSSYTGNAIAGAAPGIISSGIGIIDKLSALKKLKKLNPDDFIPKELKSSIADVRGEQAGAQMSAASARTADDAFRREQMQQAANQATQTAMLAATSPDQVQNAAIKAQKIQNQGIRQLGAEGVATQSQRKQLARQIGGEARNLEMQMGFLREKERKNIQNQIDATKQALYKDIGSGLSSVGQAFVTGGV